MNIQELINHYLLEVKFKQSDGTFRFYKSHLGHFVNYCSKNAIVDVSDVT